MAIQAFIERICKQTAVYWGNPEDDGYGGKTYDDPVEVKVRWDEVFQTIKNSKGEEVEADAKVLTPIDLDLAGMLFLGELTDIDSGDLTTPVKVDGAYEILGREKVSMPLSLTDFVRTVYLKTVTK